MIASREEVVAEAMTWLRTPYHHRARLKGIGADCAQFPVAVYESLGLIPHIEPEYPPDWHMHRDEDRYVQWALRFAREVQADQAMAGDLAIWKWGRAYSHGGILLEGPRVIHSYIGVGVTIDRRDQHEELRQRPSRFFTLWGQ